MSDLDDVLADRAEDHTCRENETADRAAELEPLMPTQRVPEDGAYVVYYIDMGDHIKSIHRNPVAAISWASAGDYIGFMRWNETGIEAVAAPE